MPLNEISASQHHWARTRWPGRAGLRVPTLDDNLIIPITSDVRAEFESGGGKELGTLERPGKMYSLGSSSALAYNFFAPWRGHDLHPLSVAFGTPIVERTLRFEHKWAHGLSTEPPNLDVALDVDQLRPLAV